MKDSENLEKSLFPKSVFYVTKTSTHSNNEHALCTEQIKNLRKENSSKNLITKMLSENQNAFNESLPQQSKSYEVYYYYFYFDLLYLSSELKYNLMHHLKF